jgi:hypothetical protein
MKAILLLIIFFAFSCSKNDTDALDNKDNQIKTVEEVQPIEIEQLLTFLPQNIPSLKRIAPTSSSIQEDDYIVNSVLGQFKNDEQYIRIEIKDYLRLENVLNYELFLNPPIESDYNTTPYTDEFVRGYMLTNKTGGDARLRVLADDRFHISINIEGFEDLEFSLIKVYKSINVSMLIAQQER